MKKILLSVITVVVLATSGMQVSFAQDGGPPQFRPVELWACQYKDGKDKGDMDKVYEGIVESTSDAAYAAWHLSPYFVGNLQQQFDFIYLGAWADGTTFGGDLASYMADSADVASEWDETVDCASLMFASNTIQPNPGAGDGNGEFVLTVSDCDVAHGRTAAQALGAIRRFNDYRVANGMTIGTFAWFPVFGGGDADFSFKLAQAYSGAQALGDGFQWSVDNQAYNVEGDMTDGLVSCDESRVYFGSTIMDNLN
ncbi:MAG: hypothetical protein ACI88G_001881 [Woeseiaceae bacterium]|jgi:hypothetical protein